MTIFRKEEITEGAPLGKVRNVVCHWSAGTYDQVWGDYHFNIKKDGTVVQTLSTKLKGAHTWFRNTGNIGISFCAMADNCPVTSLQMEAMARTISELCGIFGLDINGTLTLPQYKRIHEGTDDDTLVATGGTIIMPVVSDHAHFAAQDGYSRERWDCGDLYPKFLARAKVLRQELIYHKIPNTLQGKIN